MKTSVRTMLAVVMGTALASFNISSASTGSQAKGGRQRHRKQKGF